MGYSLQQLLNGLPELDDAARLFLQQCAEPHLALGWALAARAWNISPPTRLPPGYGAGWKTNWLC